MNVIDLADLTQTPPSFQCNRELSSKPTTTRFSEGNDIESATPTVNNKIYRKETTQSPVLRLLDLDIGHRSDEIVDENSVYFLDGVENTSTG